MTNIQFKLATLRYHQQDEGDFCGEAVAQMMLLALGAPADQRCLRGQLNKNSLGTTPLELCGLLNSNAPFGRATFAVRTDSDPIDGTRRIFTSLVHGGLAVPTFVQGGGHWLAVTGVAYEPDGKILGFFVDNPEPPTPEAKIPVLGHSAPPPHGDDDTCGLLVKQGGSKYGSADTFITTFEWLNVYFTRDGERPIIVTLPAEGAEPPLEGSVSVEPAVTPAPNDPPGISNVVNSGITRYALTAAGSPFRERLAQGFAGPKDVFPIGPLPPASGMIGSAEPYYLITVRDGPETVAIARVGAHDGRLLSLQAASSRLPAVYELHDFAVAVLERFALQTPGFDARILPDRTFTVHPQLVWRPCLQSMSPFLPFVQINIPGRPLFASLDGRVHTRLDDHPL